MLTEKSKETLLSHDSITITEALKKIDENALGVLFIVDTENKLQDIRYRISSISDELSRKIVELKVYEGYTFERIADEVHYSQRYIQMKYAKCNVLLADC